MAGQQQPAIVRSWLALPGRSFLVAVEQERIVGVGGVTDQGEITLNYVSPDVRFRGVSRAMLAALERRAVERGRNELTLASTATARRFYLASGYAETGVPRGDFGTSSGIPMRKAVK